MTFKQMTSSHKALVINHNNSGGKQHRALIKPLIWA